MSHQHSTKLRNRPGRNERINGEAKTDVEEASRTGSEGNWRAEVEPIAILTRSTLVVFTEAAEFVAMH